MLHVLLTSSLAPHRHFNKFYPINKSLTPEDDGFYLRQLYDNGARCWNGPARSSIVDLTCGTENALLDVFEAEVSCTACCSRADH